MTISFELLTVSKITSLKIYMWTKQKHQIWQAGNLIQRVPLCTLPRMVKMLLPHNHMTNLFISSYRGATIIKFGRKTTS